MCSPGINLPFALRYSRWAILLTHEPALTSLEQALDTIQMGFPKTLSSHINDLLNFALAHLRSLLPTFNHYCLSSSTASPPTASEEDHPIELPMLGCPVIDFLAVMTRGSRAKSWLSSSNVETLIVTLCGWMQMTEDDVSHQLFCRGKPRSLRTTGKQLGK